MSLEGLGRTTILLFLLFSYCIISSSMQWGILEGHCFLTNEFNWLYPFLSFGWAVMFFLLFVRCLRQHLCFNLAPGKSLSRGGSAILKLRLFTHSLPVTTTSSSFSSSFVCSPWVLGFFFISFSTSFFSVDSEESGSSFSSFFISGPWVHGFFFDFFASFSFVESEGSEYLFCSFSFIYSPCVHNFFLGFSTGVSSVDSKESESSFFAK